MKTFAQLGTEIGELVEQKARAYGESFARCGDYLRILFPDGIQPEQYSLAMLLARDFDKSMRAVNDPDAFGESPFIDKAGYAILGAHLHQQRKASEPWQGTASADAAKSSEAKQPVSAEPNASGSISPSASATTEPKKTPEPNDAAARTTSALAPTVTEAASPSVGDQATLPPAEQSLGDWMERISKHKCLFCSASAIQSTFYLNVNFSMPLQISNVLFRVCSRSCKRSAHQLVHHGKIKGLKLI